jgi:hypothetical protein
MRHVMRGLLAVAMGACAFEASALNVDFLGFGHGSESVTFTLTSPNTAMTETVSAGGFLTKVNGGPTFETYCVDLYQTINFADPAYPNYTLVPGSSHLFTANPRANLDLGRLYAEGNVINSAVTEAAFQIAVWEIAYESANNPYSLTSGAISFSGGSAQTSGALTLAASWLAALGSGPSGGVQVLESRDHQDVIYAPVPEPGTYTLMAAGLAVMGFMVRRQRPRR